MIPSSNKFFTFAKEHLSWIPARYVLGVMGFFAVANAYIMRACLSMAIVEMVRQPENNKTLVDPDSCPYEGSTTNNSSSHSFEEKEFTWNEDTQGLILSAFYWGYIITHLPGGILAQKFGGKYTLGLGILSTAIFTLLSPVVARQGAGAFIALRFLMGMGEGTTFPALSTLLAQWAPPLERSKLAALVFAGVQIGTVISTFLSGIILKHLDWSAVFYIFGGVGILWFILWCLICFNDPNSHPFISDKEKNYLQESIGETERKKDLGGTPWKAILLSTPVWSLTIAEIGHDYGLYTMVTDLPKYVGDVLHSDIAENGATSSLPFLCMWIVSLFIGYIADKLLARQAIGITRLRILLASIGAIGPAIGVVIASYLGCDKILVTLLFTIGMGFMGFCYASLRVNALDLSPNFAGTIMAIVNGAGSISGMVAPYIVGVLTPNRTLKEWRIVFWVMFVVLIVTNFAFMISGSGEVQEWNDPNCLRNVSIELNNSGRRSTLNGEPIREKLKFRFDKTQK